MYHTHTTQNYTETVMTNNDKPVNENVIQGPWKKNSKRAVKIPEIDILELQENILFSDNLTEGVMIQMIHTIGENGFAVNERSFLRDIGFIIEAVRSTLYREIGIAHPMSNIISAITKVRDNNTSSQFHFSIDEDKLKMITEILNEEETTDS